MADENDWSFWTRALAGEKPETTPGTPWPGFYRDRSTRAVAIWKQDGAFQCVVTSGYCPKHQDEIDELFGFVCRSPITRELFMAIRDGGAWPEDVDAPERGIGDNSAGLAPHEALLAEINDLADKARAWVVEIGGKITNQEQADKISNYANEFGKLENKGKSSHKIEKEPFLEGGRKVDAAWKPIIDLADQKKRGAKKMFEAWAIDEDNRRRAEAARIAEEQRKADEEARKAAEAAKSAGESEPELPAPAPLPVVENVKAGTRGSVSLRNKTEYVITDLPAFAAYLASLSPPPQDFVEACQKIARKMGAAGSTNLPGVERKETKVAA